MIILGSKGMLGSMMARVVPEAETWNRPHFDAESEVLHPSSYYDTDTIINCIGLIKPYCTHTERATMVNSLFPYTLPPGSIQIATDCVYSGKKGSYIETDPHDALDVYGKTKSLGENPELFNLRCSIIGPEIKNHTSLLDWFVAQKGEVRGFTNHYWNGITTYHFAKIVRGAIEHKLELPSLQHIVPADRVTKAELLGIIAQVYKKDIIIVPTEAPEIVDRTLFTLNSQFNLKLWQVAGYSSPPTIRQMVKEMYDFTHPVRD